MSDAIFIDGDYLAYKCAYMNIGDGIDLNNLLSGTVNQWVSEAADAFRLKNPEPLLCLSKFKTPNFRHQLYSNYKAVRKKRTLPSDLTLAYSILLDPVYEYSIQYQEGLEADDIMGINATMTDSSVIVTVDKDLQTIAGQHYNPVKQTAVVVSPDQAKQNFYTQWLTGDATDCVPGMYRVGPAKAAKILANDCTEETVLKAYEKAGYSYQYCITQGQLVKILDETNVVSYNDGHIVWEPWKPNTDYTWSGGTDG